MTSADLLSAIARLSPTREAGAAGEALNDLIAQARGLESAQNQSAKILQMLLDANADPADTRHGVLCGAEQSAIREGIRALQKG